MIIALNSKEREAANYTQKTTADCGLRCKGLPHNRLRLSQCRRVARVYGPDSGRQQREEFMHPRNHWELLAPGYSPHDIETV